jgi:hypothetical protein
MFKHDRHPTLLLNVNVTEQLETPLTELIIGNGVVGSSRPATCRPFTKRMRPEFRRSGDIATVWCKVDEDNIAPCEAPDPLDIGANLSLRELANITSNMRMPRRIAGRSPP